LGDRLNALLRTRARIRTQLLVFGGDGVSLMLCSSPQAATVNLAWDRNPETNIASYIVSYGTSSKNYTTSVNVGNVTTWSVSLATGSISSPRRP
jgi:hypothetical protein